MLTEKMKSFVADLRSGEYKQSKCHLGGSQVNCYLGVLHKECHQGTHIELQKSNVRSIS